MNDVYAILDQPDVHATIAAAFARYEAALRAHDVAALNNFFLDSDATIRFGLTEHAQGIAAVRAYRQRAERLPAGRELQRTVVTAIGSIAASVSTEFTYPHSSRIGRQTQTWVSTPAGWKILCAHVSEAEEQTLRRD